MDTFLHSSQWHAFFLNVYGFEQVQGEFVSDSDCLVYRLRYRLNNRSYESALRILPDYVKRADVDAEVAWLTALSSENSFHSPELIAAKDGSLVQTLALVRNVSPRFAIVVNWLDGVRFDGIVSEHQMAKIGHTLGLMHTHSYQFLKPGRIKSIRPALEIYCENFALLNEVSEGGDEVLQTVVKVIRDEFDTGVRTDVDHGFLHGDLHSHNLLACGAGVGVIDFSDCGWGDYGYDIATPLFYFAEMLLWKRDSAQYAVLKNIYLEEYKSIRALPKDFEKRLPLYFAVRMFVTTQWITEDLRDIDKFDWTRSFLQNAIPRLREFESTA